MQQSKVNVNEMGYGRWNEWDGLWTEGNKNETWTIKCGLKEMRWNMNGDVGAEGNEMKHEQWNR